MRTEKGVIPRRGPGPETEVNDWWPSPSFCQGTHYHLQLLFILIHPAHPSLRVHGLPFPTTPALHTLSALGSTTAAPRPQPSALRPCICRLPTNYFCLLSLLQPVPMTTGSCFWVLTTGGTQAKQVKWTRALTQFGSEGFLCHPLLAFYHPLSLHWNHKFASVGLWNPTGSCRRGHSNQTLQQILPS